MKETQTCCDIKIIIVLAIVAIAALLFSINLGNQLKLMESNLNTAYLRNAENQTRLDCIDGTLKNNLPGKKTNQQMLKKSRMLYGT